MPLTVDSARNLAAVLFSLAVMIAALVLGRDVFIPLAIAGLLCFILSPIVRWIPAAVPRSLATVSVVVVLTSLTIAITVSLSAEVLNLAGSLPNYRGNFTQKIHALIGSSTSSGTFSRVSDAIEIYDDILKKEFSSSSKPIANTSGESRQVVVAKRESESEKNVALLSAIAPSLVQTALTVLLTLFLMLQYSDLRDRVVRVIGTDNMTGTTAAMSEASNRLSHLFFVQTIINALFAFVVGCALYAIGVPNPILWVVTTFLARFVPFIGSFVAAVPPILLAMAVDPHWSMAIITISLFLIGEPLTGNVIEPIFLGKTAGLSPLAMILSASFWTIIWGPIGLLLAAPLTMMFVVLGRYVPSLEFVSVLLGDEKPLTPPEEFYHRLLSGDALAATEQVEAARASQHDAAIGDDIVLPALRLAAHDCVSKRLDPAKTEDLKVAMNEFLDGAYDRSLLEMDSGEHADPAIFLIVPARGVVDELLASFVACLFNGEYRGKAVVPVRSTGLLALAGYKSDSRNVQPERIAIVTAGMLNENHLLFISKRAKAMFPDSMILVLDAGASAGEAHRVGAEVGAARLTKLKQLITYGLVGDVEEKSSGLAGPKRELRSPELLSV